MHTKVWQENIKGRDRGVGERITIKLMLKKLLVVLYGNKNNEHVLPFLISRKDSELKQQGV
jgi:hypothetical protein